MIYDDMVLKILFSLHRKGYYGNKHTPVTLVCKRLPQYSCKEIKYRIKMLIHDGIIVPYPTRHGLDVRININKASDVKKLIKPLEDEMNFF